MSPTADKSELAPAYVICGTDTPKVRLAVRRLKRRIMEESGTDLSISVLDASQVSVGEALQIADTGSFVLGRRAVIVLGADKWRLGDRDRVADYLADPPPDTTVALVGESFAKTERLTKLVAKLGQVLRYDVPKRQQYVRWVEERGRALRLRLGAAAARHLLHLVGEDPQRLDTELAKLAAYVGAQPGLRDPVEATEADIDAVCSPSLDAQIWDLTDAVGRRDRATAFRVLEELFALAGSPRRQAGPAGDPTRSILYALARHVDDLRRLHRLDEEVSVDVVARELGVHPFRARKLLEQRATFGKRTVERATMALARADAALVGASQLEPELVLERAVAELVSG